jgi:hypothetical protein
MEGFKKIVMTNGSVMYEAPGYSSYSELKRKKRKEKIRRLLCHLKDVK